MLENSERRAADVFRLRLKDAVVLEPSGVRLVTLAPERLEHTFGALDLLQRRSYRLTPLRQVGNVADKKPADAFLIECRLQQHHHRLLIGIPALREDFPQEAVAQGKELRPWALGELANFLGLG